MFIIFLLLPKIKLHLSCIYITAPAWLSLALLNFKVFPLGGVLHSWSDYYYYFPCTPTKPSHRGFKNTEGAGLSEKSKRHQSVFEFNGSAHIETVLQFNGKTNKAAFL